MTIQLKELSPLQILEAIHEATSLDSASAVANQMSLEVARKESSARTGLDWAWENALVEFAERHGLSICSWCNFIIIDEEDHEQCRHDEFADAMAAEQDCSEEPPDVDDEGDTEDPLAGDVDLTGGCEPPVHPADAHRLEVMRQHGDHTW
jgi:hypothetical protein